MNTQNRTVAPVVEAGTELRFPFYPVHGLAGTSFKPEHLPAIRAEAGPQGFFEIHAENYMGAGGPPSSRTRACTSGSPDLAPWCLHVSRWAAGPDKDHLRRFRELVVRYEPALVSEHLAWSTHENTYLNDLLPLPYTSATITHVCDHIDEMQTTIGRPILLENPSTYVLFAEILHERNGFHGRDCKANRLWSFAGRQQRLCLGHEPRLFGVGISVRFSPVESRRNPSRRPCRSRRMTRARCC